MPKTAFVMIEEPLKVFPNFSIFHKYFVAFNINIYFIVIKLDINTDLLSVAKQPRNILVIS